MFTFETTWKMLYAAESHSQSENAHTKSCSRWCRHRMWETGHDHPHAPYWWITHPFRHLSIVGEFLFYSFVSICEIESTQYGIRCAPYSVWNSAQGEWPPCASRPSVSIEKNAYVQLSAYVTHALHFPQLYNNHKFPKSKFAAEFFEVFWWFSGFGKCGCFLRSECSIVNR